MNMIHFRQGERWIKFQVVVENVHDIGSDVFVVALGDATNPGRITSSILLQTIGFYGQLVDSLLHLGDRFAASFQLGLQACDLAVEGLC
jgi:hypothetical protein